MEKDRKTFLHVLERKLNNFRKRTPIYCHCMVLFDESTICITVPGLADNTIKIPVDFNIDAKANVKKVHDFLQKYFPIFTYLNKEYYIDKVDFRTNSFVVKALWRDPEWSAIYQMKRPISLLLKDFQSDNFSSEEKEKIFSSNIRNISSEEDYHVF